MNIVIVGGGFGGVKTALELANIKDISITLISDKSNFQYYPTLYSTTTGYSYKDTWVPLDEILSGVNNIKIVKDKINEFKPDAKAVVGDNGETYQYDKLVLALGSVTTYFGIEGLDEYAYGIKSEEEVRSLQKHLFSDVKNSDVTDKHYVIIGAGPTGVELAGGLGEYIEKIHKELGIPYKDKSVHIDLIEAAPRVLPRSSESISRKAEKRLRKLGVNVEVDKKVESETADGLTVSGKPLKSQTVVWTSGVANAPFYKKNADKFELDKRGHVVVDDYMSCSPDVYVIGDNAATPYAGLAQTALHDGAFVAKDIKHSLHDMNRKKYKAVQPASVIPIGNNWAAFEWKKIKFTGILASWVREMADVIGYHDLLPLGQAIGVWRAGKKPELSIPDTLEETND